MRAYRRAVLMPSQKPHFSQIGEKWGTHLSAYHTVFRFDTSFVLTLFRYLPVGGTGGAGFLLRDPVVDAVA